MSSQPPGYTLSDEHRAVRQMVREFGENEIEPVAAEYDQSHEYPRRSSKQAAQLDLVAPNAPVEYGGAGMDTLSAAIVTEELWRADPGIGCAIGNNGFSTNVYLLTEYGDEWMREEWLSKIVEGEARDAIAVSEAAHGSNVAGIEARAEKDGDEWVIDGNKMWLSNGNVADVVVVFAKTDPDAGHRGISAFLVPTDREGVSAEAIDDKLGIHAADLAEMIFDGVRVPRTTSSARRTRVLLLHGVAGGRSDHRRRPGRRGRCRRRWTPPSSTRRNASSSTSPSPSSRASST